MATVPETQTLIDELTAPSHHTNAQLKTWMKATARIITKQGQQIALLRGQLQEAEDAEPTELVRGKMESLIQQLDAQQRILGNIAKEGRSLRISRQALAEIRIEFNVLAADAGYTVP